MIVLFMAIPVFLYNFYYKKIMMFLCVLDLLMIISQ